MSLALFVAVALSLGAPTPDEQQAMTRCFVRASLEQPWRMRTADALAADPAFAAHFAHRCDPEIVPLYSRAYDMADEQLRSTGGSQIDRIPMARANIPRIISEMLPRAMRLRDVPPRMTEREQQMEFDRWVLDGDVSDPSSRVGRLFEASTCLGELLRAGSPVDERHCGLPQLISDMEASFASRFPEADPTLTTASVRGAVQRGVLFAAIAEPVPPPSSASNRK